MKMLFLALLSFVTFGSAYMPSLSDDNIKYNPMDEKNFWEPLQISIQLNETFFPHFLANEENNLSRSLNNFASYNISTSIKLNRFEFQTGLVQTEQNNISLNYGFTFFYNEDGNSAFLHISKSENWMNEKTGLDYMPIGGSDPHEFDAYMKIKTRDVMNFNVGYQIVSHRISFQSSVGFSQGIGSTKKMVAPLPNISFGLVIPLYKIGSSETSKFN